ncbi:MAG: 50S ribosomal protein L9 [bacterium]|nr:50S ribosomal protein L9 [bacterium]MDD5353896.1 50S ribosomal protein L9 [bacterium]MDD5756798.1 50S ribosomal protein L9 [bacterium]
MKVIMKDNIPKVGNKGEIVDVSAGYARNFLFPQALALEATTHNMLRYEEIKKVEAKHLAKHREEAKIIAEKIEKISCTLKVKAGEGDKLFGSVTSQDLQDALKKEGLVIDKKLIEIEKPIKELGLYHVPIRLTSDILPKLKVLVVKE